MGPGLLVTAAFIGPGTITTCSVAGASFGFALLWTVIFSVAATIVFQEMAARLGLVARKDLAGAVREVFPHPAARAAICVLIVAAIAVGNAAFQTGNITGSALAMVEMTGWPQWLWALLLAVGAGVLLFFGKYKLIERVLVAMVVLMSLVFIVTAFVVRPDGAAMLRGFWPRLPEGSLLAVVGLIGTTVVPYNLFLHSSSVQERWPAERSKDEALSESRADTTVAVALGGLITAAVVITAAAAFFPLPQGQTMDAAKMSQGLRPLLGPAARYVFPIGLLAAGMTSAITAPLAAAYATAGALGWPRSLRSWRFRAVWLAILVTGTVLAVVFEKTPTQAIVFAQAMNGIILPLVAVFLLVVMNRRDLLGEYRNGPVANVLGALVVLVATGLGAYLVLKAFGVAK
jgi:manganese transport protein